MLEELIGSCKLQYLVKTRYQHNRVKKILPILLGGKIIDQCLKYYSPTNITEVVNVVI